MFTLHAFHPTRGHWTEASLGAIAGLRADPEVTLWLDLESPTEQESRVLGEVFNFHPLAIEDALQDYGCLLYTSPSPRD